MRYFISCTYWIKDSIFIYPLFLSLASAYIFYLVFEVVPKWRERRNIKDQVIYHIERILHDLFFIIQDATNSKIDQARIRSHMLTEEELRKAMTNVFFDTPLKNLRTNKDGKLMKVGDAVTNNIVALKSESEILFRYIYHLDTRLVCYINEALRNIMNESWINAFISVPAKIGIYVLTPVRKDVSHYVPCLIEYNQVYRKLEDYLFANFPSHKAVLRRKLFHFMYDKQDWGKGLKIAKALFKYKEHRTESAIFIIKAYIKLNLWVKAKRVSDNYLAKKIIDRRRLEESFRYDRYFTQTDFDRLYS